jgi:hypothetical protein
MIEKAQDAVVVVKVGQIDIGLSEKEIKNTRDQEGGAIDNNSQELFGGRGHGEIV